MKLYTLLLKTIVGKQNNNYCFHHSTPPLLIGTDTPAPQVVIDDE